MVRITTIPKAAGALVILLGVVSLAGWVFDIRPEAPFVGLVAMKANTAICFTLLGLSLLLQDRPDSIPGWRSPLARVMAIFVLGVALVTLVEYIFRLDLRIDQLLFQETPEEAGASFPGRMSPASAASFLLLGTGLAWLDVPAGPARHGLSQFLGLAALLVTLLAFIGYFYGVEMPHRTAPYVTIAFHTVLGFAGLSLGVLFVRPQHGLIAGLLADSPGSVVARRLLPAAILFPLVVGWLSILAQRAGLSGLGFGTALFALSLIVAFTALIAWAAQGLNRTDAERRSIEEELLGSREQLRALAGKLQAAREQERASLAREIHDTMAQELTRLKLDLAWLSRRLAKPLTEPDQSLLKEKLEGMRAIADTSISTVQRLATQLRPVVLDTLGLQAAIEWQVRDFESRSGLRCEIGLPENNVAIDPERSTALFRILQESLTNIARHAQATEVQVNLRCTPNTICLTIRDNGSGIAEGKLMDPHSLGLTGMRERAALLEGDCQVLPSPSGGTQVEVSLPYPNPDSAQTPPR
jgi:signal transduction histidine kinase